MTRALDAVIDAALERALLDASETRRYFALAGALERARSGATPPASAPSSEDRSAEPSSRAAPTPSGDVLGATLASLVAVRALDSTASIDPGAWSPGGQTADADLVAVGAAAACRRLDVAAETVAARSGVPRERLP